MLPVRRLSFWGVALRLLLAQEVFNSPYAAVSFPLYAESIGFDARKGSYDIGASQSESIKMLSAAAKEAGVWLVGGKSSASGWMGRS